MDAIYLTVLTLLSVAYVVVTALLILTGAPHAKSDADENETERDVRERAGGCKSPDDTVF